MKRRILILILLIFASSSTYSYSGLLDLIDKDIVDQALLYLPKRDSKDLLKMSFALASAKEDYSLTDAEAAYMVYKWIGQNIEYDCSPDSEELSEPGVTAYNNGKGSSSGISDLFSIMNNYLRIENNIISGVLKVLGEDNTDVIKIKDFHWNYLLIDDKYYLIDASNGAGMCLDNIFIKYQRDFYFGTKPDIFIRTHFPDESKWQFLSKNITQEQFISMVMLTDNFYMFGFKTISPNSQIINGKKETEFTLTYDKIDISENAFGRVIYSNGVEDEINNIDYKNEDGKIKLIFDLSDKEISYFGIGYYYLDEGSSLVSMYKIKHSS